MAAYVPVKRRSERTPGKNFRALGEGRPLLTYIMEALEGCQDIDARYLFCSDPTAAAYMSPRFQFLQEDPQLDVAPINAVMEAFADAVPADVYILAHATSPFLRSETITRALSSVLRDGYDSALSVHRQQAFLWRDGRPMNYEPTNIPRTQDLPPVYVETTGLYVYRSEVLRELGTRIGLAPYLAEVSFVESLDIDEPEDFRLAEAVFNMLRARPTD